MPQPKEKATQERNKLIDESMQRAYSKVSAEMPDVKRVSVTPNNASWYTKYLTPRGSNAVTNPFTGNIIYNPESLQGQSQNELEQIVGHELTHTRQTQNTPWYKIVGELFQPGEKVPAGIKPGSVTDSSYQWQPREMEAFQAERDRATRNKTPNYVDPVLGTRDIPLHAPRKKPGINTGPSFVR